MNHVETLALYEQGIDAWNQWADSVLSSKPTNLEGNFGSTSGNRWLGRAAVDFSSHNFDEEVDFTGFVFPGSASFKDAVFSRGVFFEGCRFERGANFQDAKFIGISKFDDCRFKQLCDFNRAEFRDEIIFLDVEFEKLRFNRSSATGDFIFSSNTVGSLADFKHAVFVGETVFGPSKFHSTTEFDFSRFDGPVEFRGLQAPETRFLSAELEGAKFVDMDLRHASFERANLTDAFFAKVLFDNQTTFSLATVVGCSMNKAEMFQLLEFGGLSIGDRMHMDIRDDAGKLRMSFSGYQRWFHVVSLATFSAPYLWFLVLGSTLA